MTTLAKWTAAVALALSTGVTRAEDPTARGFDADTTHPALGVTRGIAVETASIAPAGSWAAGLRLDWMQGFLAYTAVGSRDQILESRLTGHLMGAWAFRWFELGVDLPVIAWQEADFSRLTAPPPAGAGYSGPLTAPVAHTALGDLRFTGKVPILGLDRFPVGLSALLELRLPTGNKDAFTSDGTFFAPQIVATRPLGPVRLDAQVGYQLRGQGQYAQLVVHDALAWGVGASTPLPKIGALTDWRAHAEVVGAWPRGNDLDTARYRSPLSAIAGLRVGLGGGWEAEAGGSTGLGAPGYGRESWRVFCGIRFAHQGKDSDGDGVLDEDDWCPGKPGLRDNHGCPEGPIDLDADHDGVNLPMDKCPDAPGTPEMDGCPDADFDFIPDPEDACPNEPGPATNNGCPLGEEPVVELEAEKISLKDAINFETAKDTILPKSNPILDSIALILKNNPDIPRVRVEGHTDNVGSANYNRDLSQRRAQAVVNALVQRGIAAEKLLPKGYGFDRPVASNATALGRAKNRRVEFTILREGEGVDK
ncbi:MAG TPA: OmpA family protein [Anaeromyxobacteraceae bacterium]|nr:OmpA family protein [Anaeromyxobacteraceae bacterium]